MSLAGFNPRNVLRQTSNGLLEEMFGGLKIPMDVNWSEAIETDVEPIFQAYQSLEEPTRQKIELLLRDLHSMATESGQRSIFQQAIQIGEDDFLAELERFDSRYDVAMLTYLSKPEVWQVATRFAAADRVIGGRSSQRRINLPSAKPRTSPQHMKSFSGALSAFYSAHQGRGRQCVAEYLLRCENLHYVFASLDDYRKTFMKLIDGGNAFKRVCETHVFENVFAYDEANHVLDVYALGGKPTIGPLQKIFAREFLGIELPPEDPNAEPFSLGVLLDPKFRFPTDPEDAVRSVVIAAARVLILGSREKLHFNPNVDFGPSSFQRMIERYIRQDNLPRSIMHIERVDLRFRMENGHEFNLSITRPNRSTIKSLATRDRLLAEKYLRQWGIDLASDCDAVSVA